MKTVTLPVDVVADWTGSLPPVTRAVTVMVTPGPVTVTRPATVTQVEFAAAPPGTR